MNDAIEEILGQLTLEEKAALCVGAGPWKTVSIERLGIPGMVMTDGPHEIRRSSDLDALITKALPSTCFPTASSLACTWNRDLLTEIGQALADEALSQDVNVVLGPGMNIKRSPLCGRNFEYLSEDPFLTGEMAASLVNGVQSMGVGVSLKHYVMNNQEFKRMSINVIVDERTMREIYLAGFEMVVKKSQPWTVMCSYNKVNGQRCSEHHELLNDILKKEWGFEGLVVSDWGAVRDRIKSLRGGLDLEMPGPQPANVQSIIDAVRNGQLDEVVLDESVRRILTIALQAAKATKKKDFDVDGHDALASRAASEGMVLLKNNGILPLKKINKIAVIGYFAKEPYYQGGGSSHINATKVAIPLDEIMKQAVDCEITYADGYTFDGSDQPELIDEAFMAASAAEVAILFIAPPSQTDTEGVDRLDLEINHQHVALIKAVTAAQPNSIVILNNGAPLVMREWIDGPAAVLEAWMMGQAGAEAIADILFGKINPSGKLAETFPYRLSDTPAFMNWPGELNEVRYGEGMYVGYRYYDLKEQPVLFPFGHGLSYTTFSYSNPRASTTAFKDTDGVIISVDVTNTGEVAGKEVVQVYVRDVKSTLVRPVKELKGFAKVELQPGETKTVSISLDKRAFAFWHPAYHDWVTEEGDFEILIGASSADIRQQIMVFLQSTRDLPCILDEESTFKDWLEDANGKIIIEPMYLQMKEQFNLMMGGETASEAMGSDLMGFILEMPLIKALQMQQSALPASADQIIHGLLLQAKMGKREKV